MKLEVTDDRHLARSSVHTTRKSRARAHSAEVFPGHLRFNVAATPAKGFAGGVVFFFGEGGGGDGWGFLV